MKPMTVLMTAAIFSVLSLNACGGSEKSRIQEQTEARFQLNPHPKQAPPQNQNQRCARTVEIDGEFWSRLQS